jgi:superfamily I DNA/RNA helicase
VNQADFFNLVNEVLVEAERDALPHDSPARQIIEVNPDDCVLQVLAGPGSGKTETLTWRVLYELFVNSVPSNRVMVTTFTRRAATELQVRLVERSDSLCVHARHNGIDAGDPHVHDIRVGTLHSLCDSLLAELDPEYLEAGTTLIDDNECLVRIAKTIHHGFRWPASNVVRQLASETALTHLFRPPWLEPDVDHLSSTMARARWAADVLGQLIETWGPRRTDGGLIGVESVHGPDGLTDRLDEMLARWHHYISEQRVLDFRTIQQQFRERHAAFREHLTHVFVDEFQDNNPIQFAIHTGWLEDQQIRLTVVGDDDQAIYRFRGSDATCFSHLQPYCADRAIAYRQGHLETNYRSTKSIISFANGFRAESAISDQSMEKTIAAPDGAGLGTPVRLLQGQWPVICATVAEELAALGVGRIPDGDVPPPTAAILMFSTSERATRDWTPPAVGLRAALEARHLRVFNPRNKLAASGESEVGMLLGLLSYLIDPVTLQPVGAGGRNVETWASCNSNAAKSAAAVSQPLGQPINEAHIKYQKWFRKPGDCRRLADCPADRQAVLDFVDEVRTNLVNAVNPRLSISGLVARLLALPFFRESGFTEHMFRQALFTQLLEANIAPTRLTQHSLDMPIEVSASTTGKLVWDQRFWWMLHLFGAFLERAPLDDLEIEAFEEHAVPIITFHQAKGLEFDYVYVAATGRDPDVGPALRTRLFSGEAVAYEFEDGLSTDDPETLAMATADRDREVYVALTRAKSRLTILHDEDGERFMALHPVIDGLFADASVQVHPDAEAVRVREHQDG